MFLVNVFQPKRCKITVKTIFYLYLFKDGHSVKSPRVIYYVDIF